MDREIVKRVEDIYRDPNQAVGRYGVKAHADLVVIELAKLDELRAIRALLEQQAKATGAKRSRSS